MNVAFVTLGFRPFRFSGLDVSGERLVDGLVKLGHNVSVIAGFRNRSTLEEEKSDEPNLKVYRIHLDKTDWIGFSFRAAKLLNCLRKTISFDIVHFWDIHFACFYFGEFVGSLHHSFRQRSMSLNTNYYRNIRWLWYKTYYLLSKNFAEYPALRRAKMLLAVSETTGREYELMYKIPPHKIVLTRHGIDTNFFKNYSLEAKMLRAQLGIRPDVPIILFTGFITPRKSVETLLKAISTMDSNPCLVMVGEWRNNSYRKKVMEKFRDLSIIEVGFVDDRVLPIYYSMADVYVSPSLLEGFGLTLVESLACETPVVAIRSGSTPEVVGPGGFLVEPKDYIKMAERISLLLNDPELRRKMAKEGRAYVECNFNQRRFISSTIEAYNYVVNSRARAL